LGHKRQVVERGISGNPKGHGPNAGCCSVDEEFSTADA